MTHRAWFSRLVRHPARKWSGSILTTPEPARSLGRHSCHDMQPFVSTCIAFSSIWNADHLMQGSTKATLHCACKWRVQCSEMMWHQLKTSTSPCDQTFRISGWKQSVHVRGDGKISFSGLTLWAVWPEGHLTSIKLGLGLVEVTNWPELCTS